MWGPISQEEADFRKDLECVRSQPSGQWGNPDGSPGPFRVEGLATPLQPSLVKSCPSFPEVVGKPPAR